MNNLSVSNSINITDFFQQLDEFHLDSFLTSLDESDWILSEPEFESYVIANFNEFRANCVTNIEVEQANLKDKSYYLNFLINHRTDRLPYFEQNDIKRKYFDFIYDVVPYLLSKPSHINTEDLADKAKQNNLPQLFYLVICTPRSGSSFLCDLLKSNIGGNPLEHLRNPLLHIISNRHNLNIDLEVFLNRLFSYCSKEQIFGTKIISHFLFDLLKLLTEVEKDLLINYLSKFKIIYLHRQDKYAQAISRYIASKIKSWHVTASDESLQEYHEKTKSIEYDFQRIKKIYENFVEAEKRLQLFLDSSGFKDILFIEYENLKQNPKQHLQTIANFCKVEINFNSTKVESRYKVLSSETNDELISKFKQEYEAKKNI